MLDNLTTELLNLLNNPARRFITVDNQQKPVVQTGLSVVLQRLFDTELSFEMADFEKIITVLEGQIDKGSEEQDELEHHLALSELISFVMLVKVGIVTDDLGSTQGYTGLKETIEDLTSLLLKVPEKSIPVGFGRFRRRFIRRPRGKKSTQPFHTDDKQTVVSQLTDDCQQLDDQFIQLAIVKLTQALDQPNTALKPTITLLAACHNKYAKLLNTHVERCGALLHLLMHNNHYTLTEAGKVPGAADELIEWMSARYQDYQSAQENEDNPVKQLYGNIGVSRFRLQLLVAQMQEVNLPDLMVYTPTQACNIYEQAGDSITVLDQMMSAVARLVSDYWQELSIQSTTLDAITDSDFKLTCNDIFAFTQQYKHRLMAVTADIDKMVGKTNKQPDFELLKRLNDNMMQIQFFAQSHQNKADHPLTVAIAEINEGQLQFVTQDIRVSRATFNLFNAYEQLACICYSHKSAPTSKAVDEIRRQSDITLQTVIKSMDGAYTNWLQMMSFIRNEKFVSGPAQSPEEEVPFAESTGDEGEDETTCAADASDDGVLASEETPILSN